MIIVFKYPKGKYRNDRDGLFSVAVADKTRSNGLKLQQGKFRLEFLRNLLAMRLFRHWNKLPKLIVASMLRNFQK